MKIRMTGIDHTSAGIDIRTIFSFTKKNMEESLEKIREIPGVDGCVILSTCNRMELWVSSEDTFEDSLLEILCRIKEVPADPYRDYFTFREGDEAVTHLFRLAGGLESRILGEDQIVTQVGEALRFAREHYATDNVCETLFRMAVTAAKKVKTQVELPHADHSVVTTAVEALKRQGRTFCNKRCMVIGNGVMGKLAANTLRREGAEVTVTIRQYRSGMVEIPFGCARIDYGERMRLFGSCDYVFSATVSPNFTLTKELIEPALNGPVVLIDLAVPRDIDPDTAKLDGVELFDIDSFREGAESEEQRAAIREAELLFEEQKREFFDWFEGRDLIPRIQRLKEEAAEDLEGRLEKKIRQLDLNGEEKEELIADILQASQKAVNKMLFGLKDEVSKGTFLECLDGLEKVYES